MQRFCPSTFSAFSTTLCCPKMATNTRELLRAKVFAMADYIDGTYDGKIDTTALRAMPIEVIAASIVEYLLPHKTRLEDCEDLLDIAEVQADTFFTQVAQIAGKDPKLKRYLIFFCELLSDDQK
jgi:hypothetical protein